MMKMKNTVIIMKCILALLIVLGLGQSCTEEHKEPKETPLIDCTFKINVSDITGNSVKLSAIPTKMSIKYYLSAVRKDIYPKKSLQLTIW